MKADHNLSRANILAQLPTAPRSTLESWRSKVAARRADLEHFFPDWPGLAESFADDLRAIEARLAETGPKP